MLSKITIEVDFANNNMPIIRLLVRNSDDIRDKLLEQFINKLPSQSAWCKVQFISGMPETSVSYDAQQYSITPLTANELKEEAKLMLQWFNLIAGEGTINQSSKEERVYLSSIMRLGTRKNINSLEGEDVYEYEIVINGFVYKSTAPCNIKEIAERLNIDEKEVIALIPNSQNAQINE